MVRKLVGCIVIICVTTILGISKGMEYRSQVDELDRLKRVIWHLKGEICYTRNSLADICYRVAKRVDEPYTSWLYSMSKCLEKKGYSELGKLWEEEIRVYFSDSHLSKTDMEEFAMLGYQLGYLDVERQEETLKWYGKRLEERRKPLADKLEERRRLCTTLGVMAGIFLSILLL